MNKSVWFLAICVAIPLAGTARSAEPSAAAPAAENDDFVSLFNGRDLAGWTMGPDRSWVVEDGLITLRREMDSREHNADYLWTEKTYGDFILELEFKTPDRANSGIFLRTSDRSNPVYTGIEVQVSNSHGLTSWGKGNCAGTSTTASRRRRIRSGRPGNGTSTGSRAAAAASGWC